MLVAGDGSPTQLFALLSHNVTTVKLIDVMAIDGGADSESPEEVRLLPPPLIRRRVWLQNGGVIHAYAVSWWSAAAYQRIMRGPGTSDNERLPIGRSLATAKLEVFREVKAVYCGTVAAVASRSSSVSDPGPLQAPAQQLVATAPVPDATFAVDLAAGLGVGPADKLWGRHYVMFNGGSPLTVIAEVFSPRLEQFLGLSARTNDPDRAVTPSEVRLGK
jgi:chorismate lyase